MEKVFEFGSFQLDQDRRLLLKDGQPAGLGGRAFDLLLELVVHAGDLVAKDDLMHRIWPDTHVEETNLRVHVAAVRKALGEAGSSNRFIETVAGRGYAFVMPVVQRAPMSGLNRPIADSAGGPGLPAPLTRAIGRDQVVDLITADLRVRRSITIVGPGGLGKTTVAWAVARQLVNSYEHGVCVLDLAPLNDQRLVSGAFASRLNLNGGSEDILPVIQAHLRNKSMLVVLDNCEHVIDAAAMLAECILGSATGVHLLATSREPLRFEGESLHRLSALTMPPRSTRLTAGEGLHFPAVELFVERAKAVLETFELRDDNVNTVSEICRRLDGIPLAIELAAARINLFGLNEFSEKLSDYFSLLIKGRRTALPRHQTLRATLDWSHNLLSIPEQAVLRRLALMAGAFTATAAIAVTADATIPSSDVMELMADLVDKSLIGTDAGGPTIQYRLLQTTRAYAADKLRQSGDFDAASRRHALYFLARMQQADEDWKLLDRPAWLAAYAANMDDVRVAINWALMPDGDLSLLVDLLVSSAPLWSQLSLMAEYSERAEQALHRIQRSPDFDPVMEMRLQAAFGNALWYSAFNYVKMVEAFTRTLAIAETIGDVAVQLRALWGLWAFRRANGEFGLALSLATQYFSIAEQSGDPRSIALGHRISGISNHYLGHQKLARMHWETVRTMAADVSLSTSGDFQVDPEIAEVALLSRILWLEGFPDQAHAAFRSALDAAQRADHAYSIVYAIMAGAWNISLWIGDLAAAAYYSDLMTTNAGGNAFVAKWCRCYALVVRLCRGNERDRLAALFIDSRLDLANLTVFSELSDAATIELPLSGIKIGDTRWNLPEILRVDAEILLWQGGPDARVQAEAKLLHALELAREAATLSWELRCATSLARLWNGNGRRAEARSMLIATHARFREGFETEDVRSARRIIQQLS